MNMENDSQYFTTTPPDTPSAIDGELTVLVDEDGEMVLDITQTLSNFAGQNEEGSLVIITTDETHSHLDNSTITYNILQENARDISLPFQNTSDFVLDDSHIPIITLQEPTTVSDQNEDQTQLFQSNNTSNAINYVSIQDSLYVPGEGQTLFVMESPLQGATSQIKPITSQMILTKENHGYDTTSTKIRRLLPKPSFSNSTDARLDTSDALGRKKHHNISTLNYEICTMNPDLVVTTGDGPTAQKMFICDKCPTEAMKFQRFGDLSRHYVKMHHLRLVKNASVSCREQNCSFKSWRIDDLRKHLNLIHGFSMEAQTYNFTSMEEFIAWKTSEEKSSGSKFNRSSGDQQIRRADSQKVLAYIYYACNRSGTQRIRACKENGKKKKSNEQESIKINGTCTASIRLIHDKVLNQISCDYCPTHYGHDIKEPHRQYLSKQEKDWILQLLLRGWNSDEIVKTLRSGSITGTSLRMMSVTRQDVFNVYRSHGVANFERRDPDDKSSVKLWVEELRSKSSVLIWNPEDNVLLLAVMNENQTVLARIHARIVYVTDISLTWDRYHRLIALSALSATDDEAYLLAYAITDQNGLEALQAVFAAVQAKLGQTFQPEFILSQNPSTVADAWIPGTDSFPIFLSPPWNVKKEWDEGRVKYIDNDLKREAVKKCLDILLAESDPSKFSAFLQLVNGMLNADESLLQFSRFFVNSYSQQAAHWSRFHPLPDCSSLHQLNVELELIARRCRALKRLDKCIYSLEFLASNQPYQPMTEFRCSSTQKESQEVCNLHHAIAEQMKTLERVAHECDNLDTLKRINGAIRQALE